MSELEINVGMACIVIILFGAVATWWLKAEGEKEWRRYQQQQIFDRFWAAVAEMHRAIRESQVVATRRFQEFGRALRGER